MSVFQYYATYHKTGTLIFGYTNLILFGLLYAYFINLALSDYSYILHQGEDFNQWIYFELLDNSRGMTFSIISIILAIWLLIGVHKDKIFFLKTFMYGTLISMAVPVTGLLGNSNTLELRISSYNVILFACIVWNAFILYIVRYHYLMMTKSETNAEMPIIEKKIDENPGALTNPIEKSAGNGSLLEHTSVDLSKVVLKKTYHSTQHSEEQGINEAAPKLYPDLQV